MLKYIFFIREIMKFKRSKIWLGILAALILVAFSCILLTNGQSDDTGNSKPAVTNKTLNSLLEHRTRYIGDAVNVSKLLDKLPYGKNREGIELATDSRPYGITINYRLEDIEVSSKDTIKSIKPVLQDNALILFSLIENVDTVKFNILPVNTELQFERPEMQQYFDRQLWEYSSSEEYFEEFLFDIYFKIYIYPEKYSMTMSSVPGMRVVISLNASLYDATCSQKCSTENGTLLTWDRNTSKITDHGKSLNSALGEPVYWSPLGMEEADKENVLTISILDADGDIITEKRVMIEKDDTYSYSVRPSYDIITGSYHDFMEDGDAVNENAINENDEFNKFNELTAHAAAMEELLDNSNFQYMTRKQIEETLSILPEIIRENYDGIGRMEGSGGYLLLTCKDGAKRLPEDTISHGFSPGSTNLSQLVLEDSRENEICRFPLSMHVTYHRDEDIFFIAVGDEPPNMKQIIQIKTYQLSGIQEYIRYAKQAKERGTSIFNSGVYPQIVVYIWIDGISPIEYVPVSETLAQDLKEKLNSPGKTRCDTSTLIRTGIAIHFGEEYENHYELCMLPDGTGVIHKNRDKNEVLIDHEIYDSIMDIARTRTAWEWVELSEIHDIVRAEMRMKMGRGSEEQVQVVEDDQSLKELETLFSNAKYFGVSGCPFTALLLLTREDGKVITLQIATDSCDMMILGTSAGYDYGPEPRGPGQEGTVNRQEVLKRIFNQINWER